MERKRSINGSSRRYILFSEIGDTPRDALDSMKASDSDLFIIERLKEQG